MYVASVPALQECHTQAKSVEELLPRIREAVELYIEAEAEEIRARVRMVGHNVMVQKAKDDEVWRAHALAQMEMAKRESKPVPLAM